ncbi:MAG TPA: hypothetical protein ENN63_11460 [Bacteroidetes bacterium]|nr:hypothetical protein [Bacteroidota bacterium]
MQECIQQIFYLNDRFLTCEGFSNDYVYRGQSLYEVIRVMQGVPVFFEDHMERMQHSASVSGISLWLSAEDVRGILAELVKRNQEPNGNVRVVFNIQPSGSKYFLAYYCPHFYPTQDQYRQGVEVMVYMAERQNPTAKLLNMGLRLEVYKAVIESGVYEALLVNRQGQITEGSRSNAFFIRNGKLITAPDQMVLKGISRKYVLQFLKEEGIPVCMEPLHLDELEKAEAAFLTGTSPKVLPVNRVRNQSFNTGHPLLIAAMKGYDRAVDDYIEKHKE